MGVPDLEIARTKLAAHPKIRVAMETPTADIVALIVVAHPESPVVKAALIPVPKAAARRGNRVVTVALETMAHPKIRAARVVLETMAHPKIQAVMVALETMAHPKIRAARVDLTLVSKVVARLGSPAAKIVLTKIRAAKDYVKMATVATPAHGSMLDYPQKKAER
jgi:hypothetical protein